VRLEVARARHDDDLRVGRHLAELRDQLDAGERARVALLFEVEIEEDDVGPHLARDALGLREGRGLAHDRELRVVVDDALEAVAGRAVIVNEHDADLRCRHVGHVGCPRPPSGVRAAAVGPAASLGAATPLRSHTPGCL
jgi:hypothetical protein